MTHTVTNFVQTPNSNFRVEGSWHKLEGIYTDIATPLYDATGHKMENPNYVIDLYYKVIIPGPGKDATDVFFKTSGRYKHTDLTLLCNEVDASPTFLDSNGLPMGAILGSDPVRGSMFLPDFNTISGLPTGTVIGNLTYTDYWASRFQGVQSSNYAATFLNCHNKESSSPHNLLLSGVSYTDTSITYTINPSFATCGIPVSDTSSTYKYIMPELRSGFVMIDNVNLYNVDTISFGALYMCLDVHAIQ